MREKYPDPEELKGAVQGTLLYLFLYICFIMFQSFSKFYLLKKKKQEARAKDKNAKVSFVAIKYYNSKDKLALAGDRTVGNYIEFAIVFLPCMWLHALFVDPSKSFTICALYTASRSLYPFMILSRFPSILLSTIPGYCINAYLLWTLLTQAALT